MTRLDTNVSYEFTIYGSQYSTPVSELMWDVLVWMFDDKMSNDVLMTPYRTDNEVADLGCHIGQVYRVEVSLK